MGWLVIIGSIPIVVLGLLFQDAIDTSLPEPVDHGRDAGRLRRRSSASPTGCARNVRPLESLTWRHGVIFGLAQSLALIPGVSRSGATIAAGLAWATSGWRPPSTPSCWPSRPWSAPGSSSWPTSPTTRSSPPGGRSSWPPWSSFVIGYAVIAWLLRYISTHNFLPFVIYRLALAAVVAVLLLTGVLEPLPGTLVHCAMLAAKAPRPVRARSRATRTAYATKVTPAMMAEQQEEVAPVVLEQQGLGRRLGAPAGDQRDRDHRHHRRQDQPRLEVAAAAVGHGPPQRPAHGDDQRARRPRAG